MWYKQAKNWLWLFVLGSLWGLTEVVGGEALYANDVPFASVWLTAAALFLLAVGRGLINKPGTSAAIGAVAAFYKLANAAPFYCHLLGIFMLGLAFDVFATLLLPQNTRRAARWKPALVGALSAYAGNVLFAVLMTFIARYPYWVKGGLQKFSHHILVSGSLAALASLALVPLGFRVGAGGEAFSARRPRWAVAGAALLAIAAWIAGRMLG